MRKWGYFLLYKHATPILDIYIIIFTLIVSTSSQEIYQYGKNTYKYSINKTYKNRTSKKFVSKLEKKWPKRVNHVLEENALYRIVSAKIEESKYSFVTLISVNPVLDEDRTIETYFAEHQTNDFMEHYKSENIDIIQCPELLCGLVFSYTGEALSNSGHYFSCFKFIHPDANVGLAEGEL